MMIHDISEKVQTQKWAEDLASLCRAGDVVTLTGDLGTGKTTFVQYFCASLGVPTFDVSSPTFGLVHVYAHVPPLWHFDLYRLHHPHDLDELGLEEAFADGISLIEWPDVARPFLPSSRLDLHFSEAQGQRGLGILPQGEWIQRYEGAPLKLLP